MKKYMIPAVLCLSLLGGGASFAMGGHGQGKMGPAKRLCKMQQLSESQCQQTVSILKNYRAKIVPLKREARVLQQQLNGKIATKGTEWQDIEALTQKIAQLHQQVFTLKTQARFEVFQKAGVLMPHKKSKRYHHKPMLRHVSS